jgi:hypothetical protein
MKRSGGITICAAVVFIGSAATLLFAAAIAFSVTASVPSGNLPPGFRYAAIFVVVAAVLFAIWGIASGIGLLERREWARISMIVFSVLLLAIAVPGLLMFLFAKVSAPASPPGTEMTERAVWITRLCGAGVDAFLAGLAVTWLRYFNLAAARSQFSAGGRAIPSAFDLRSAARVGQYSAGRPLSITIIAGLMVLESLSLPALLVFRFPMMFLGYFFTGPEELLIVSAYAAVQIALARGLWTLKPWGRSLAIYYFNFAIFNAVVSAVLPGAQGRYEAAMAAIGSTMNRAGAPPQMHIPLWLGLFFSLPFIAIQLWFLMAAQRAFEGPQNPSSLR